MKKAITGGVLIGSSIGGLIPALWGDSLMSYSSVLWSGIGGLAGVVVGIYVGRWLQGG